MTIDRSLGAKHPEHGFIYPVNYGYLEGTMTADGEKIEAYVIGEYEPLSIFEGYVVAIAEREDDVEDKLVVCKEEDRYTRKQIEAFIEFQERFFETTVIMEDDDWEDDDWEKHEEDDYFYPLLCCILASGISDSDLQEGLSIVVLLIVAIREYANGSKPTTKISLFFKIIFGLLVILKLINFVLPRFLN